MVSRLTKAIQYSLASKKYLRGEQQPNHSPTTQLWKTGDGRIHKSQVLVSGWNVNGFRSVIRKKELVPFWQALKPDFLCLNQTKVDFNVYQKEIENKHLFEGYHQYWNFSKISSGYSGVMILTPHKPISIIQDLPESNSHSLQGRMLTLQYQSFFLVNVYKPNAGSQLQRLTYRTQHYDTSFNAYMANLLSKKKVIIFGDMNVAHNEIDLANPKSNRGRAGFTNEERGSFQNLLSLGFTDTFRCLHPREQKFTYWSYQKHARLNNIGWRIDYILTSPKLKIIDASIHDQIQGSDHCPVSALIKIE